MKRFILFLIAACIFFSACDLIKSEEENYATKIKDEEEIYTIGISVYTANCKTKYYIGEEADFSGIVVKADYIGQSSKDVTKYVEYSGFDSSAANSYQKITVSYTEDGKTYSASFYVSISDYPRATYPYDRNRIVKVSFQYYRRESTAEPFVPFIYSEEPYDDINGTVTFKINDYGMNYKVGDVVDVYMYYPNKSYKAYTICNFDNALVKNTKYIVGNSIVLEPIKGSENVMPESYLFTDKADVLGTCYGSSTEFSVLGAKTLQFEDFIYKSYKSYYNKKEVKTFKGLEYPKFEVDSDNVLTKATILKQPNNYFACLLTVETKVQDVEIEFPAELWGIDHLE